MMALDLSVLAVRHNISPNTNIGGASLFPSHSTGILDKFGSLARINLPPDWGYVANPDERSLEPGAVTVKRCRPVLASTGEAAG